MTKDELIVKQQLEIESLKVALKDLIEVCEAAVMRLNHVEQWSIKAEEFPKVSMRAIVSSGRELSDAIHGMGELCAFYT